MYNVKIDIPQQVFVIAIKANALQRSKWGESKLREVERMQHQVWEYVCAIIQKEANKYLNKPRWK